MSDSAVGILIAFILFIVALVILSIIFWIFMLVDSIQHKYKDSNDKVVWVLVIVFTGIIGALIYYFVVKRNA
jgi:hypothetical protein